MSSHGITYAMKRVCSSHLHDLNQHLCTYLRLFKVRCVQDSVQNTLTANLCRRVQQRVHGGEDEGVKAEDQRFQGRREKGWKSFSVK